MQNKTSYLYRVSMAFALLCLPSLSMSAPVKVEIVEVDGGYQLLRGGEPYVVKGAGIEYGDIEAFAKRGGNTFRTWTVDSGGRTGQELLDYAHSLGLTVSLNLPIKAERWGFDYDDPEFVANQLAESREYVLKHKDHPALFAWIIGNELNYSYKNAKVYDAVNDISKMIHELDPNHPTTTTVAGYSKDIVDVINQRAPDLDFISFQLYGDLINLPRYIKRDGFKQPYFITEWGAVGHWEVGKTAWGAPIEQNSTEKAANYLKSYKQVIQPFPKQVLGNHVFLWGQKQERTGTWYGMYTTRGEATETIDVMEFIWKDSWPENRTPQVKSMLLDKRAKENSVVLRPGKKYQATVKVKDPDGDKITYTWEVRHESKATQEGGDKEEIPKLVEGVIKKGDSKKITLVAPNEEGPYRLFMYANDGQGHAAHANIPFYVQK